MVEDRLRQVEVLITELKKQVDDLMLRLAVRDERERQINEKLARIQSELSDLTRLINRVGWIVVAAVVGGIMKFVLDGGLVGLTQ